MSPSKYKSFRGRTPSIILIKYEQNRRDLFLDTLSKLLISFYTEPKGIFAYLLFDIGVF